MREITDLAREITDLVCSGVGKIFRGREEGGEAHRTEDAREGPVNSVSNRQWACLVPALSSKISVTSNVWIYVWSIKYRLITKVIAQLATNLRDESFKTNQSMI